MKSQSILVLNEGYSDNLGDQAINDSLHFLLKEHGISEIVFNDFTKNLDKPLQIPISKSRKNDLPFIFRLIKMLPAKSRWLIRNVCRVIKISKNDYDRVIIGGGQLVLTNNTFSVAMATWVLFLRLFGNNNIYICGVGLGTKFSYFDRLLFKYSLRNMKKIYLRDRRSQDTLAEIFELDSELIYDVAFIHNKIEDNFLVEKKNKYLLGVITYDVYKKYVQTVPLSKSDFFESWIKLLNHSDVPLIEVRLFYTTKEDRLASLEFKSYVKNKYHIELPLAETSDLTLLIAEIKASETVISARMHALILGFTYKCNIITYPISDKLIEFKAMIDSSIDLAEMQSIIETQFVELLNGN